MKKTKKGFTLVELVIVVAVMAVLVAVAIPTVSSIVNSAQQSVDETNAQTIESMIKLAQAKETSGSTLTDAQIKTALDNANLGIDNGTYYYEPSTGACYADNIYESPAPSDAPAAGSALKVLNFSDGVCATPSATTAP